MEAVCDNNNSCTSFLDGLMRKQNRNDKKLESLLSILYALIQIYIYILETKRSLLDKKKMALGEAYEKGHFFFKSFKYVGFTCESYILND